MTTDIIAFYVLVSVAGILSVILLVIVLSYIGIFKKLYLAEKEIEKLKRDEEKKEEAALEKTQKKANEIIERANSDASQIINKTLAFDKKSKEAFEENLNKISRTYENAFKKSADESLTNSLKLLKSANEENVNLIREISKDIKKYAGGQVEDFKKILLSETVDSQKIIGQKIEESYGETQEEIKKYRQKKFAAIDNDIYEIIENVTKIAMGKSLSLNEHEDLIMEALNKAKEEAVL